MLKYVIDLLLMIYAEPRFFMNYPSGMLHTFHDTISNQVIKRGVTFHVRSQLINKFSRLKIPMT